MDVETAVRRIMRQFGDEYGVVITEDDVYGWIYEAETDIIRNTGCNDNTVTIPTISLASVAVPTAVNIKRVTINDKALQYITVAEIDLLSLSLTATGSPQYWYKESNKLSLYPVSTNATEQAKVYYNKVPAVMTGAPASNTFTVPDVYHDDVIKYCIARAHNKNNNLQAEQAQMTLYDRNLSTRRDESQAPDATLYKGADPMDFEEVS